MTLFLDKTMARSSSKSYNNTSLAIDTLAISILEGKEDRIKLCRDIGELLYTPTTSPDVCAMYRLAVAYEINRQLDEISRQNFNAGA
ncbi:hypothetical protein HY212_04420 [Candidatus Pacearchaeota archaeon]|nr:hypothetical protein [Candidatus Pacearchaeota archaeon]